MNWHILAIISPLLFLAYLLIIDSIDLFPFNDVEKHTPNIRFWEFWTNYIPLLFASFCNWYGGWLSVVSIILAATCIFGWWWHWWRPYFFGTSEEDRKHYEENFGRTYKFLPPIKDHPIPDAEHMPVGPLAFLMLFASIMNFLH